MSESKSAPKRAVAKVKKDNSEMKVDKETLEKLLGTVSQNKIKQAKKEVKKMNGYQAKEKTEAQKEAWAKLLEANRLKREAYLERKKEEEEKLITIKAKPPVKRKEKYVAPPKHKPKVAPQQTEAETESEESESETEQTEPEVRKVKKRVEKRVQAVQQIQQQIQHLQRPANPYSSIMGGWKW